MAINLPNYIPTLAIRDFLNHCQLSCHHSTPPALLKQPFRKTEGGPSISAEREKSRRCPGLTCP